MKKHKVFLLIFFQIIIFAPVKLFCQETYAQPDAYVVGNTSVQGIEFVVWALRNGTPIVPEDVIARHGNDGSSPVVHGAHLEARYLGNDSGHDAFLGEGTQNFLLIADNNGETNILRGYIQTEVGKYEKMWDIPLSGDSSDPVVKAEMAEAIHSILNIAKNPRITVTLLHMEPHMGIHPQDLALSFRAAVERSQLDPNIPTDSRKGGLESINIIFRKTFSSSVFPEVPNILIQVYAKAGAGETLELMASIGSRYSLYWLKAFIKYEVLLYMEDALASSTSQQVEFFRNVSAEMRLNDSWDVVKRVVNEVVEEHWNVLISESNDTLNLESAIKRIDESIWNLYGDKLVDLYDKVPAKRYSMWRALFHLAERAYLDCSPLTEFLPEGVIDFYITIGSDRLVFVIKDGEVLRVDSVTPERAVPRDAEIFARMGIENSRGRTTVSRVERVDSRLDAERDGAKAEGKPGRFDWARRVVRAAKDAMKGGAKK